MSLIRAADRVRSFVDLRAFAADASPLGDCWLTARAPLPLAAGPASVAALVLDGGEGRVMPLPADEFVIVLNGGIAIAAEGVRLAIGPGDSAVLPGGARFLWRAEPGTRAIVMACEGTPGGAGIVPIDPAAPLAPSAAPLAELLVGPTPACRSRTDYRSASGEFLCGTWASTPYHRLPMRYRHHELMHLLAGAVTFVDEAGGTATFAEGDVFLIEQGAECSWDSRVDVKKAYAIYRPG